jgi:hypothetical protein
MCRTGLGSFVSYCNRNDCVTGTTDFALSCGKRGDTVGATLIIIRTEQNEKDKHVFNLLTFTV